MDKKGIEIPVLKMDSDSLFYDGVIDSKIMSHGEGVQLGGGLIAFPNFSPSDLKSSLNDLFSLLKKEILYGGSDSLKHAEALSFGPKDYSLFKATLVLGDEI